MLNYKMEWIEIFEKLGLVLGISAILAVAGVFVLKRVLELIINRDLEKFKSELERESTSHKIRYERLHGERMEVIKNTYQKLAKTQRAFKRLISPLSDINDEVHELEKKRDAAEAAWQLTDYFEDNRIFFNESLAADFDNLLKEFNDIWVDFELVKDYKDNDRSQSLKVWTETWKRLNKEVPLLKTELEAKFRGVIGVEYEN